MRTPLRVLLVEDSQDDAQLILDTLRGAGYEPDVDRVETAPAMRAALESRRWDVIICAYAMAQFSGLAALALLQTTGSGIPLIMVSGVPGEEAAVAAMKAGAHDYILKGNLAPLVPAVERELREVTVRRERAAAEEALRKREERYRRITEAVTDHIFTTRVEQGAPAETVHGPGCVEITGYTAEKLHADPDLWIHIVPEADRHLVRSQISRVVSGQVPEPIEYRIVRKDGAVRWVRSILLPHNDPQGIVVAYDGLIRDVTERKLVEEELRQSNEKFGVMFSASLDAILIVDCDAARIIQVNPAVERVLGYMQQGLIGKPFGILYPGQSPLELERWKQTLQVHGAVFESQQFLRADGVLCPMDLTATLIPWENDRAILVTLRDARERHQTMQELNRMATIVEQASEAILVTDQEGTIQYVNPSFERISGYSRQEVVGENPRILKSGVHGEAFYRDLWSTIKRGEVWRGRITNKTKYGLLIIQQTTISPIRDYSGRIVNYISVSQDVTQQDRLEAQLRQAQKMEAIGVLAGGIAHDFNNILSPILGYTDLILSEVPKSSPIRAYLEEIYKAGERARNLVKQILTFSRRAEQEWKPVDVATVLNEALTLVRASLPSTIAIEKDIDWNSGLVLGDSTQLHQILMNLCTNAYHAMREKGGVLRVVLDRIQVDEALVREIGEVSPGLYVRLQISDTGPGIPPDVLERIFDPFFTTKHFGEGTGMGLSTVHGIVANHKGAITVKSEPGKGATFTVHLPCMGERREEKRKAEKPVSGGTERILLVEDEVAVARLGTEILTRLGYRVATYTDSRAALERFRQDPYAFDVVVTDQTMPGLTGVNLATELLRIRPGMPIVLMSGFSEFVDEDTARRRGIAEFVLKPVLARDLDGTIRRAIEQSQRKKTTP